MVETTLSLDEQVQERIKEEWVREALRQEYKNYTLFQLKEQEGRIWGSNHAYFQLVRLSKVRRGSKRRARSKMLVVKRYIPVKAKDPYYELVHDPDFLFPRELRNLRLIRELVGGGLVPIVYGDSPEHKIIVMEYLGTPSWRDLLVDVKKQLESSPDDTSLQQKRSMLLYQGIKNVARFIGLCNANQNRFLEHNPNYLRESDRIARASRFFFKENLYRVAHTIINRSGEEVKEYDYEKIDSYFRQRSINIDQRLGELWDLASSFHPETKLIHGDFNPAHLKKQGGNGYGKVLDLEKFGLGDEVDDLSSFCIITALGNNYIIKGDEFVPLLNRYLAYEYAFKQNNNEHVQYLNQCNDAEVKEYIAKHVKISKDRYANILLNFFAHAIRKNAQLAALYDRTTGREGIAKSSIERLFEDIGSMNETSLIDACTDSRGVRNYFHCLGHSLNDLNITKLDPDFLDRIKTGSVSSRVYRDLPNFG